MTDRSIDPSRSNQENRLHLVQLTGKCQPIARNSDSVFTLVDNSPARRFVDAGRADRLIDSAHRLKSLLRQVVKVRIRRYKLTLGDVLRPHLRHDMRSVQRFVLVEFVHHPYSLNSMLPEHGRRWPVFPFVRIPTPSYQNQDRPVSRRIRYRAPLFRSLSVAACFSRTRRPTCRKVIPSFNTTRSGLFDVDRHQLIGNTERVNLPSSISG